MSSSTCTWIRRSLMAVLAAAVLLPATWMLGGGGKGEVVRAAQAGPQTAQRRDHELTGIIIDPEPVPVIAPVGGAIVTVTVDEGTTVQAGEVLAVLAHDDTKLIAPVSGVILRRSVNRGSVVRPDGAAPFLILPNTAPQLVIEVDRVTSRSLRAKSIARFTLAADKEHAFKARFSSVRTEPTSTGTLRYLASFSTAGSGAKVLPGMKVAVELQR
jgi:multidrug efflux pump subunit AcrA (membrane-fusion protein)